MAGSAFVVIIDRAPRENITLTQRAGIRESGRRRNARATHRSSYMRVHGRISLNGPCCQNKHTPRTPAPLGIQMQEHKCIFSLGTKRHSPCLRRCENYARVPECGAFSVSRARILNFRRLSHGNLFYAAPKTDCWVISRGKPPVSWEYERRLLKCKFTVIVFACLSQIFLCARRNEENCWIIYTEPIYYTRALSVRERLFSKPYAKQAFIAIFMAFYHAGKALFTKCSMRNIFSLPWMR